MVSQMERTFRGRSREYEDLSMSFCDISIPYHGMASVDSTEVHPGFLNTKTAYRSYRECYINSI